VARASPFASQIIERPVKPFPPEKFSFFILKKKNKKLFSKYHLVLNFEIVRFKSLTQPASSDFKS
jgi:hypothetical protein